MNGPDQDFERQLKETFASHAGDAPRVNLTDGALRQAGRIRTHRRIAAGLVAAGIVAVAVPVGVQLSDTSDDRRPIATNPTVDNLPAPTEPIDIQVAGLEVGDAPSVPYIADNTFYAGGLSTKVSAGADIVTDAIGVSGGVIAWSQDPSDATKTNYSSFGDGAALPKADWASNAAYDPSTKQAAWAVRGVDGDGQPTDSDTILVASSVESVDAWASVGKLKVAHVIGALQGQVVFNAQDGRDPVVGRVDVSSTTPAVEQPWTGVTSVTAIDPGFTRIAAIINGDKSCSTMLGYDDASKQWSSCKWRPVEFSADGTRVLGLGIADGLGPNEFAVLDSATGALIQKFTTAGFFGRMTFEDNDTIVGVVAVDGQVAITRCAVGGACELGTDPAKADTSLPEAVLLPYQLTAN